MGISWATHWQTCSVDVDRLGMDDQSNNVVKPVGNDGMLYFWCPGCQDMHGIWTEKPNDLTGARWSWNGSYTKPTFKPSIFSNKGRTNPTMPACHSYVIDGKIKFLNDCTHELAGKTVDLQPPT